MGKYIAEQTVKRMIRAGSPVQGDDVIVLGLTFKENCPDTRNTRVIDVIRELESYGARVHVHDPVADVAEARHEYGIELTPWDKLPKAKAIVFAVAHQAFVTQSVGRISGLMKPDGVLIDVKCAVDAQAYRAAGVDVWRL